MVERETFHRISDPQRSKLIHDAKLHGLTVKNGPGGELIVSGSEHNIAVFNALNNSGARPNPIATNHYRY